MTLHWWMHWFWVTALLLIRASSVNSFAFPQAEQEDLQQITAPPERRPRAMYYSKPPSTLNTTSPSPIQQLPSNTTVKVNTTLWTPLSPINATDDDDFLSVTNTINKTEIEEIDHNDHIDIKTPSIENPAIDNSKQHPNIDNTNITSNVTVIPIIPANAIQIQNVSTNGTKKRNLTKEQFVKDEIGVRDAPESKIVTEKPLSLETSYLQTRIPPKENYRRTGESSGGLDAGAVWGLSFGALGLGALCASTAFVLYRRRYLNKPQTLHDKCSNPDSSPYLDDSTVRDNSEEMYSLDNDSFLNSLEAMTIQNYWTDTVKHTKL